MTAPRAAARPVARHAAPPRAPGEAGQWAQLMPLGGIADRDGRRFRPTRPDAVIADFARRGHPLPVDWEHASASARETGRAAPAAGWITEPRVEDGMLRARIDWTERGRAMVAAREYRFPSPEFHHDPRTGEVRARPSAGLVQPPNLRLAALNRQEPIAMTDASDPDMPGGAAAPIPERLRTALGLGEGAGEDDAPAAVARLREQPDPARFVPVAATRELMAERHARRRGPRRAGRRAQCAGRPRARLHLAGDGALGDDALSERPGDLRRLRPGRAASSPRASPEPPAALSARAAPEGRKRCAKAAAERIAARLRAAGHAPAELPPALHDHRPGRRATLATDPELRAFVEARFNRMTFEKIADAAEAHFGERRLAKSAIHDWYKKNHARAKRSPSRRAAPDNTRTSTLFQRKTKWQAPKQPCGGSHEA
ncbi:MAG: phage protease [Paracoccaceae bacterium]